MDACNPDQKQRIDLLKQDIRSVSFQMFLKNDIDIKNAEIFNELNLAPEKFDKLKVLMFDYRMASLG